MEVIDITYEPPRNQEPIVLCIGKFDGVHLGHQRLLRVAADLAAGKAEMAVMSFSPHPAWALTGNETYKKALTPIDEKLRLLEALGVSRFYRVRFTKEYAKTDVDTFVFEHLSRLNVKAIVVGEGFNFGKPYDSGTEVLSKLCQQIGISVIVVPVIRDGNSKLSSTIIRHCVTKGSFEKVQTLLGRPYQITGTLVEGSLPGDYLLHLTSEGNDGIEDYILPCEGSYKMKVWARSKKIVAASHFYAQGSCLADEENSYRLSCPETEVALIKPFINQEVCAMFIHRLG
ncbi:bifunctional riboflavin kinase/FMN adenylyltransferase [Pullulanibacillus camelliae]|uniref:Riboflavin biosynthesis protein n=1 Tax=Pullulanibacillus camelliae TaxID=1707096 RepID=A0A8J2VI76_9BACL|nr:hypothetical protein [Pullulanibacillus camelliae]GGE31654.1 bifunctional riboflavin kinase/FMN adenylyltransferase [Pullulanibacillus camelliae]